MERELSPKEEKEYLYLIKKSLHTVLTMSKKDWERLDELWQKKYGTPEEQEKEIKENRKNFLKLQEKLSKKQKNK